MADYQSAYTGKQIDEAVAKTNANETAISSLESRTKNLEDTKVNVNTGTFDPTSDNPAGQTSLSAILSDIELKARYASMMTSGKCAWAFYNMSDNVTTTKTTARGTGAYSLLGDYGGDCLRMFASNNTLTEIADYSSGLTFSLIFQRATGLKEAFRWCPKLVRIGTRENPYNVKNCTNFDNAFSDSVRLKEIHMINISVSFDISSSNQFEESDLVEILSNLMDLTGKTAQTLTMGATNLSKLTDAEKAIATNKNWVLA